MKKAFGKKYRSCFPADPYGVSSVVSVCWDFNEFSSLTISRAPPIETTTASAANSPMPPMRTTFQSRIQKSSDMVVLRGVSTAVLRGWVGEEQRAEDHGEQGAANGEEADAFAGDVDSYSLLDWS